MVRKAVFASPLLFIEIASILDYMADSRETISALIDYYLYVKS